MKNTKLNFFRDQNNYLNDRRVGDPYVDRRSGVDRRQVYDYTYWESVGVERRSGEERRRRKERRDNWAKVSKWSSIRFKGKADD